MTKKVSWKEQLQTAVTSEPKANSKPSAAGIPIPPVVESAEPVQNDIRVIVRDARKPLGDMRQVALRLPAALCERIDRHIAGQRHAALIAILEFGLDELVKQNKVLEVK